MKRWVGVGLLVLSAMTLFTGWATWTGLGDEADQLQGARALSAKDLDDAREGEVVALEGTALETHTGPVSGEPAAWYRIARTHHWEQRRARCRNDVPCSRVWGPRKESAGSEVAPTMDVRLADSDRVLHLRIPKGDEVVARVYDDTSDKRPLDVTPTDTHRGDYEVRREYLLEPDAKVTVAGAVDGTGSERTITRAKGLSLVYNAPRSAMIENLEGYRTAGKVMVLVGVLMAIGGVVLVRASSSRSR